MQKLKSLVLIALFGIAALGLTTSPVKAVVIYSYTGNNFTKIFDDIPSNGSFDTSMSVTGSFTVSAPLLSLSEISDISASVLSFSFFDGRTTLDDSNTTFTDFNLSTDSSGAVTDWYIDLRVLISLPTFVGQLFPRILTTPTDDLGVIPYCITVDLSHSRCTNNVQDTAFSIRSPGTWTFSTVSDPVPIPEPSTLLLFGVGLAGLAGFGRRRRKV